jgi:hypothetical protein
MTNSPSLADDSDQLPTVSRRASGILTPGRKTAWLIVPGLIWMRTRFHDRRSSRNHVISDAESMLFLIGLPLQEALEAKIFYQPISSIFPEIK